MSNHLFSVEAGLSQSKSATLANSIANDFPKTCSVYLKKPEAIEKNAAGGNGPTHRILFASARRALGVTGPGERATPSSPDSIQNVVHPTYHELS